MQEELRAALAGLLDGLPPKQAAQAVERLITNYRGATPTDAPVLRDRADVAAYAAYRMPATFEAVRAALAAFAARVPDWSPATHVDIGGGTGAATWAAAATWEGHRSTVLDWAQPALDLGRELAAKTLPDTEWRRQIIGEGLSVPAGTDLVTVSYVLGELRPEARRAVVAAAAEAATVVVLIEPGTPDGYLRIREARTQLTEAGLRIVAPCPHSGTCPIVPLVQGVGAPPAVAGETGATSPPGSAAPPSTARSRAAPSRTRTKSSATSPPPPSTPLPPPPASPANPNSARARSSWTCAPHRTASSAPP